jgi:hypothetical protein
MCSKNNIVINIMAFTFLMCAHMYIVDSKVMKVFSTPSGFIARSAISPQWTNSAAERTISLKQGTESWRMPGNRGN